MGWELCPSSPFSSPPNPGLLRGWSSGAKPLRCLPSLGSPVWGEGGLPLLYSWWQGTDWRNSWSLFPATIPVSQTGLPGLRSRQGICPTALRTGSISSLHDYEPTLPALQALNGSCAIQLSNTASPSKPAGPGTKAGETLPTLLPSPRGCKFYVWFKSLGSGNCATHPGSAFPHLQL